ncbi:MAG: arginine deiminase [Flexilinea sp.]|nr:arginine deiminase [Flexilinea sp.]
MCITVKSEIGQLTAVMLHRPGKELEHLSPRTMSLLLFDDIPFLHQAQTEHDAFASLLRENNVEVLYLEDLAAEAIAVSPDIRTQFIEEFIDMAGAFAQGYRKELTGFFQEIRPEKELIRKTMEGIPYAELFPQSRGSLSDLTGSPERFIISPMPNLYFTRDPFASIGNGVSIHRMYSLTRQRETIYGKYIFEYHPKFAGKVRKYYTNDQPFSIEGGDILNLSPKVLAVGISQRTQTEAIEQLAKNIFTDPDSEIQTVLAFYIPNTRAFMHLDTVFTQVDHDKFTVHPGILPSLRVYELKRTGKGTFSTRAIEDPLEKILERYLGLDHIELIHCGGDSDIAANREQWNDGSNTLCISPGKVLVYDRNYITNAALEKAGVSVLPMNGSELSRGRGGPRCMSMPFLREALP